MPITTTTEMITAPDGAGSFACHVALPEVTPAPAIIVVQEIFGVNRFIQEMCRRYAQLGYVAVAPDIFWREKPGIELTDQTQEEWQQAFGHMQAYDQAVGTKDLIAVEEALRGHGSVNGTIGVTGYCLGGRMCVKLGMATDVDAIASYYGVGFDDCLEDLTTTGTPVLFHIAENDKYMQGEARDRLLKVAAGNPALSAFIHPGADHAFARTLGGHYDPHAAGLADMMTADFLATHLKG